MKHEGIKPAITVHILNSCHVEVVVLIHLYEFDHYNNYIYIIVGRFKQYIWLEMAKIRKWLPFYDSSTDDIHCHHTQ